MQDADQSYDQLLADNTVLRQQVATLEAALVDQTERETVFEANERRVAERTEALQRVNTQLQVEIDARHRIEAELRFNEAYFRSLVQNASDIIALVALNGTVHYYSPSIQRILGYCPKDLIGRRVFGAIHPEDMPRVKDVMARLAQYPGVTQEIEVRLRHRDGTWRDFEAIGSVPLDGLSSGGVVVNARDITERKRVEAALRESEARLRAFADALPDLAFVLDQHGRYIEVLTTQEHLLYREAEQLKGRLLHEVLPQTVANRFLAMIRQTLNTDRPAPADSDGRASHPTLRAA